MPSCIMLVCIMRFLDRKDEMRRLDGIASRGRGGLVVLVGRRRIGKTRILVEWSRQAGGLYTVADESAPDVQRRYVAQAIAQRFADFARVEYPDWTSLLTRLAREARAEGWSGPFILDELPYLVASSPGLPSAIQRWIDHEARDAGLVVALAGSSQRMMQGLVLSSSAPLYGRASEILEIGPMAPRFLGTALGCPVGVPLLQAYCAWGGVPRYWELAVAAEGSTESRIHHLVLDPLGPLHREPDRILQEETPSALEVRPVLDAIGSGANRVSEIAGRLGRLATSMARPLQRLVGMGLVRREVPFGEEERRSRRALYEIDDPFFRLWFRVVAPHRGELVSGTKASRLRVLRRHWPNLLAQTWENLCRQQVARVPASSRIGRAGPWGPASRWWRGNAPEWDLVSESESGRSLLLGEVKAHHRPLGRTAAEAAIRAVRSRPRPDLGKRYAGHEVIRALFVPELARGVSPSSDVLICTARDLI